MNFRKKHTTCASSPSGMSFIEVLVWISIVTILTGVMSIGIIKVYRSNSHTFERAIAVLSARKGLENVTNLVREARYNPLGAYPVVAMSTSSMSFYADYDNDGTIELMRIFTNGDALNRGIIEPNGSPIAYTAAEEVSTLVHNMRNEALGQPLFEYYDEAGAPVASLDDVLKPVFIKVHIITNTGKNGVVSDYALQGSAFMRNLKN